MRFDIFLKEVLADYMRSDFGTIQNHSMVFKKNQERTSYKRKILEVNFYSRAWTYIVVYGDENNLDR